VEQRGGGALLQAFREKVAGQRLLGHEPVQVGMRERERTVGTGKGGQRLGPVASGGFEGGSGLLESDGDDGGFQGGLARQVLVEGGRADPEPCAEPAHRQRLGALLLQQFLGPALEGLVHLLERGQGMAVQ
jgi:hypothetical protein